MAYTSVTYADISSGTEVRRTEPKCPHISKLSKERLVGARKAPTGIFSRRCQKGSDRNLNEEAHNGATVRRRSASRWARRTIVCAESHPAESLYSSGAIRRPREIRIQVGAAHNRVRRIPPSGEFILKRRHTAATRERPNDDGAVTEAGTSDRCSCKRSPCTAHSQTGVVANVHHARRTARPAELQTFTMHGAQPARSLDLPRSSCVAHSQTGGAELGPPTRSQHLKKKARRRAKPKPTTGAPRRRPAEGRSRRPASHAKRKIVGGAATTAGDRESSRMCPCCGGAR